MSLILNVVIFTYLNFFFQHVQIEKLAKDSPGLKSVYYNLQFTEL